MYVKNNGSFENEILKIKRKKYEPKMAFISYISRV